MTTTREARYLSGNDLGKTVRTKYGEVELEGVLATLGHSVNLINEMRLCTAEPNYTLGRTLADLGILTSDGLASITVTPRHPVTITGTDTPAGFDLHNGLPDRDQ